MMVATRSAVMALSLILVLGCDDKKDTDEDSTTDVFEDSIEDTAADTDSPDVSDDSDPDEISDAPDAVDDPVLDVEEEESTEHAWPDTPDDYTHSGMSRIDSMSLPEFDSTMGPACCRDFGAISRDFIEEGTDLIDNALGSFIDSMSGMGMDFDATMNEAINDDELVILFDHVLLDGVTDPDGFILVRLDGEPDGSSGYLVSRSSFVGDTGTPRETFPAQANFGAVTAYPGVFEMPIPTTIIATYPVQDTMIIGDIALEGGGVSWTDATLSGYLLLTDFLDGINKWLVDHCDCVGPDGSTFARETDGSISDECTDLDSTTCDPEADGACIQFATFCPAFIVLVENLADLEIDASVDGYDAISWGMHFTAVPADVTGIAAP